MKNKTKVKFTSLDVGQEFYTPDVNGGTLWKKTLKNKNFKGLESGEAVCLVHATHPSENGRIKYFNHVANAYIESAN
jgi:hypothetical protein